MANLPTSIKNLNTLLGEQLTEGGGGGSSDFSTAEVTLYAQAMLLSMLVTYDGITVISPSERSDSGVYTVVLYNGRAFAQTDQTTPISGDIESLGGGTFLITGNCTIGIQE